MKGFKTLLDFAGSLCGCLFFAYLLVMALSGSIVVSSFITTGLLLGLYSSIRFCVISTKNLIEEHI